MDELALNKSFFIGFERTVDLLNLISEGDEGEAEVVGIFIACVNDLADRWNMTEREAINRVSSVIKE